MIRQAFYVLSLLGLSLLVASASVRQSADLAPVIHVFSPLTNPTQAERRSIRIGPTFPMTTRRFKNRVFRTIERPVQSVPLARSQWFSRTYPTKSNNFHMTVWINTQVTASLKGSGTEPYTRSFVRTFGDEYDVAGHMIANILGGPGGETWNIMPQNSKLNNGDFKSIEGQIRSLLKKRARNGALKYPSGLAMFVDLEYPPMSSINTFDVRPTKIRVLVEEGTGLGQDFFIWKVTNPVLPAGQRTPTMITNIGKFRASGGSNAGRIVKF